MYTPPAVSVSEPQRIPAWPGWVALAGWLAACGASVAAYPFLPETVAIHWSGLGEPDGFGPRLTLVLLMPIMIPMAAGLLLLIGWVCHKEWQNQGGWWIGKYMMLFSLSVEALMLLGHGLLLAYNLGWDVRVGVWMAVGVIVFLVVTLGGWVWAMWSSVRQIRSA